jgi:hypothetical protein
MRVCANLALAARDVRLDLFRGLANWAIFLDHIPHEILSSLTTRNYGFSDAADLFVFISGYTAAMVFGKVMIERGYLAAALRLARRAFQLYAAHMAVVAVYIAVIAWVSRKFHDPDDLNQFNVAVFMSKPLWQSIQTLALRYKPVNLDVLPLYILLLGTFAPALWLMVRKPTLILICSNGSVFCRKAFWLESCGLAIGLLMFQSLRVAIAVFPRRLDRPRRRRGHSIGHQNQDGVLARDRLPCLCLRGDDGHQRSRP